MIHNLLLKKLRSELERVLITEIEEDDPTRAGVVVIGPLQGNPDPDVARISITLHENDPEAMLGKEMGGERSSWEDEVYEIEIGGAVTWERRFTVQCRCLLENTREDLDHAREIASTLRSRIEKCLFKTRFSDVFTEDETVVRGVFGENIHGEMVQSGGPPDAYDFHIKIRFDVLTMMVTGV